MSHDNHSQQATEGKSMSWSLILVIMTLGALGLYLFSVFMLNHIDAGWAGRRNAAEEHTAQMQAQAEALPPVAGADASAPTEVGAGAAAVDGKAVYERTCASCHQATGLGVPSAFPPLVKSEYVSTGDPRVTTHIVLKGLSGEVKVDGQGYNGLMPAWENVLSDAEIAAVVTYIRSSWGNSASAVDTATVAAERAKLSSRTKPLTVKELK